MAGWKERNFVPDSDDEEGLDDLLTGYTQPDDDPCLGGFVAIGNVIEKSEVKAGPGSEKVTAEASDGTSGEKHQGVKHTRLQPRVVIPRPSTVVGSTETRSKAELGLDRLNGCRNGLQEHFEDELALPGPRVAASTKKTTRLLNQLFSDDNEPDELLKDNQATLQSVRDIGLPSTQLISEPHQDTVTAPPRLATTDDAGTHVLISDHLSMPSSPLTDLSSIDWNSQDQVDRSPYHLTNDSTRPLSRGIVWADNPSLNLNTSQLPNRRFRARKDIQKRPFSLESEHYQRTLKARGIKPVRIVLEPEEMRKQVEASSADVSDNDESQTQNDSYKHQNQSTLVPVLSPMSSSSMDDDDDLPELEALLRNKRSDTAPNGFKRRRINHTYSRSKMGNDSKVRGHAIDHGITTERISQVFELTSSPDGPLPSPASLSSSQPPTKETISVPTQFRFPRGMTPPQLQTPAVSSETKTRAGELSPVEIISEDDSINGTHSLSNGMESLSSGSDPSPLEAESESEVALAQRRIRGVLPASWIRLDQRTQRGKPNTNNLANGRLNKSPTKDIHRGVARPISTRRKEALSESTNTDPFVVSDGSMTDGETSEKGGDSPKVTNVLHDIQNYQNALPLYDSDSMEDNQIDPMLPTSSRARRNSLNMSRNRQTKLPEILLPLTTHPNLQRSKTEGSLPNSSQPHRSVIQGARSKRRKLNHERPKHPRHTISETEQGPRLEAARFAAGIVKSRRNKTQRSIAKKHPQRANRASRDYQQALPELGIEEAGFDQDRDFSEGRQPLRVRSGNEQDMQFFISGSESDTCEERAASDARKILGSGHTRSQQKRIDEFVDRNVPSVDSVHDQVVSGRNEHAQSKHGQIWSHPQPPSLVAPAMLETERQGSSNPRRGQPEYNPIMERYLEPSMPPDTVRLKGTEQLPLPKHKSPMDKFPSSHKRRRARKVRFHPDNTQHGEGDSANSGRDMDSRYSCAEEVGSVHVSNTEPISGLLPFGTEYSISFNIRRLPDGPCFEKDTLLGSGTFSRSLALRDLDNAQTPLRVSFGTFQWDWGSWNETVSTQIGLALDKIVTALKSSAPHDQLQDVEPQDAIEVLEGIVHYFTDHLFFLDPIDRKLFLERCGQLMSHVVSTIREQNVSRPENGGISTTIFVQISSRCLVIVNQLSRIADHHLASPDEKTRIKFLVESMLNQTAQAVFRDGFDDFILSPDETTLSIHQLGNVVFLKREAFVILLHVLKDTNLSCMDIWEVLRHNDILVLQPTTSINVQILDQVWQHIFSILPLFAIDAQGEANSTQKEVLPQNWKLVKQLINPVLKAYLENSARLGSTFNAYCRSMLGRCLHLIQEWNWVKCDTIIGTLFDFFAKNNLRHLRHEESRGSPRFLESLDESLILAIDKRDLCFHIFLKIFGVGIRKMRLSFSKRTIRNISWRLIPNHSRDLPKDQAIRHEDLDEVRNHHDLLCLLYWATPPVCRIPVTIIEKLVDLENSHKEACYISVRSWSNLIAFQISTNEPVVNLDPFVEWYNQMLGKIIRQHKLARTEVESQAQMSEVSFGRIISKTDQEWAIGNNQRQTESILGYALGSLRRAIVASPKGGTAAKLLTPMLGQVFDLFDAKQSSINNVIIEALEVISAFIGRNSVLQSESESQDYGDPREFENIIIDGNFDAHASLQFTNGTGVPQPRNSHAYVSLTTEIHTCLRNLLSNCFGADTMVDDALLIKAIETWLLVARHEVKGGGRCWDDYVGRYSKDSWNDLRSTEQTRKFTPLFLARIMAMDGDFYEHHKAWTLRIWMEGLVERESVLKFQNVLTRALLNRDSPLFYNPPFNRDSATGKFEVSLADFRERRLSLIDCVLSNMRESLSFMNYHGLQDTDSEKKEYEDILKHLMRAMKENYQSLGQGPDVRGAYVSFVHRVIDLLQQHTTEICPIDRFFLELSTFPLPEADPKYVVSRLKGYALRLHDPKIPKQLASYVQGLSENAAVDRQQPVLVVQLQASMQNQFEDTDKEKITLRSFLLETIVPAYADIALGTLHGWMVATPIFTALQPTLDDLLLDMDCSKLDKIKPMESTLLALLHSLQQSMTLVVNHEGHLELPRVIRVLTMYFGLLVATLRPIDYFIRLGSESPAIVPLIQYFRQFALFASSRVLDIIGFAHNLDGSAPQEDDLVWTPPKSKYHYARVYASQQFRDTLSKNWRQQGDKCLFGSRRVEVRTDLKPIEEEVDAFLAQVQVFMDALDRMPALGGQRRAKREVGDLDS